MKQEVKIKMAGVVPPENVSIHFNEQFDLGKVCKIVKLLGTVELQWLKHLWNHEICTRPGVVQAYEC